MNALSLSLLAIIGGICLAAQGGFNATLGILLKNPLLATCSAFLSSTCFSLIYVLVNYKDLPAIKTIENIPIYLWFTGGFLSLLGISLYYYTIPKLGLSTMISLGLCGQLLFSVIAGHFGWLNLPTEPITLKRLFGVLTMLTGILIIQKS